MIIALVWHAMVSAGSNTRNSDIMSCCQNARENIIFSVFPMGHFSQSFITNYAMKNVFSFEKSNSLFEQRALIYNVSGCSQ